MSESAASTPFMSLYRQARKRPRQYRSPLIAATRWWLRAKREATIGSLRSMAIGTGGAVCAPADRET